MKQKIFRVLADLRFSIFILLLISFCSVAGTIIEQDQLVETYKVNYPLTNPMFGFLSWNFIVRFGLDHLYTTWWFLTLLFFFGLSLSLCSFLQQLPSLKIARRCQFFRTTKQFYFLKMSTVLNNLSFSKILSRIKTKKYSIFQQKNIVYCYKGLIGRIAPIVVHFSMILILIGITIGSLFGFKAQEIVPATESFHIQNTLKLGSFANVPKITARVNDFWITYTKKKTIAQFYSDLSILDKKGNEVTHQTIRVNLPLVYKDIYYYQTDWNLVGLRFQTTDFQIIQYPLVNIFTNQDKIWFTWVSASSVFQKGILLIVDNLEGYYSIYDEQGNFLENAELNEGARFTQFLAFVGIISSTGLQIKIDSGIFFIYFGFFFLMLSIIISYTTYSQIWIIQKNKKIFLGGNTNRAMFDFELEFFNFAK